jgi:hypothetical protein
MQRINLGEWTPDQPGISGSLTIANNVVPQQVGYGPFPEASAYSNPASQPLLSSFAGIYGNTSVVLFAGGATKLFKFDNLTAALTDVSKAGSYTTTDGWEFAQFGNIVIAANNKNKLQAWNLTSSTVFADLSANAPIAKFVTVVRDFVVTANLDAGTNATKVQWSDLNDETDWIPGPTSQSDFQEMSDGGNITGLTGGEFGLVLMERAIARMTYSGSPYFFQFDIIARGLGCIESGSVAQYGQTTFFLSDNGFYSCNGQVLEPIGAEKVDRYFLDDADQARLSEMSATIDPLRKLVVWEYRNNNQQNGLLIYNWQVKRWSSAVTDADYLSTAATPALTLEALDSFGTVDSITTSFDSRVWVGGKATLAGIRDNSIITFTGGTYDAEIATGDIELSQNSLVGVIKPLVDQGSCNAQIASRRNLDNNINYSATSVQNADGRCPVRSAGRFHRIKLLPIGDWTAAVGMDIEAATQGGR